MYALISDLHNNYEDTLAVLTHINQVAPKATIICLGDQYECHISKRKAGKKQVPLSKAMTHDARFERLLAFPTIIGNQEERIDLATGQTQFIHLPRTIRIPNATLIHGHQFDWNEHFEPTFPAFTTPLVFFGHSHRSAIYQGNKRIDVGTAYSFIASEPCYINIGAVIDYREWCLYDSLTCRISFMQAPHKNK